MSQQKRKSIFSLAFVALALGIVSVVTTGSFAEAGMRSTLYVPFAVGDEVACGLCDDCTPSGGGDGHATAGSSVGEAKLGPNGPHPDDCQDGTCNDNHPLVDNCGEVEIEAEDVEAALPSLEELWTEMVDARGEHLRSLIALGGAKVEFNEERGAVQFFGCNGNVIAHLPMTRAQALDLQ